EGPTAINEICCKNGQIYYQGNITSTSNPAMVRFQHDPIVFDGESSVYFEQHGYIRFSSAVAATSQFLEQSQMFWIKTPSEIPISYNGTLIAGNGNSQIGITQEGHLQLILPPTMSMS